MAAPNLTYQVDITKLTAIYLTLLFFFSDTFIPLPAGWFSIYFLFFVCVCENATVWSYRNFDDFDGYWQISQVNTIKYSFIAIFFETANKIATRMKLGFRGDGRYNFLLNEQIMDDVSGILQVRLPAEIAMFLENLTFFRRSWPCVEQIPLQCYYYVNFQLYFFHNLILWHFDCLFDGEISAARFFLLWIFNSLNFDYEIAIVK